MYYLVYHRSGGTPLRLTSELNLAETLDLVTYSFTEVDETQYNELRTNPALFLQTRVYEKEGKVVVSRVEAVASAPKEASAIAMSQVFDPNTADLVFDNGTVFLQKQVKDAKVRIHNPDGSLYMTLSVDLPVSCEFPAGGQVFCLAGYLQTFYVS
jgi:hypothetical protein